MPTAPTHDLEHTETTPADAGLGGITDDMLDLTDRRRVLLRAVFGVDVEPQDVDLVFATDHADD